MTENAKREESRAVGGEGTPKPYYEDDSCTIYHGDCREVLPFVGRFGALVTDPPYGMGADNHDRSDTQRGKALATSRRYDRAEWDNERVAPWLIEQAIAHADHAIVWGGNHLGLQASPCWLVWDKDNGDNGYADCELAWTNLTIAVRRMRYRWMGMLQEHSGRDKEERVHPTQKPVAVMRWCIQSLPEPSRQSILDPFLGSGTTLRAAKDLGVRAVGIEIEERYCEIAARRLGQEVLAL